eukprot:06106_1
MRLLLRYAFSRQGQRRQSRSPGYCPRVVLLQKLVVYESYPRLKTFVERESMAVCGYGHWDSFGIGIYPVDSRSSSKGLQS